MKSGRVSEALEICSRAIEQNENDVDAWYALSCIHLRSGSSEKAIESAKRACHLSQNQVFHLTHLGTCLVSAGYTADARDVARLALHSGPSDHFEQSNLGALFVACDEHQLGADLFKDALNSDNNNSEYWYNLASAQRMLGEIQSSLTSINQALAINPLDGQAHYLRSDLTTQSRRKNHVDQLKDSLAFEKQSNSNRVLLRFALAKELEDIGHYSESFAQLNQATATVRQSIKYDVADDLRVIHEIIGQHSAASLRSLSEGFPGASPIFIVGLPRSGTTLVERVLATHKGVVSVGEQTFFANALISEFNKTFGGGKDSRFEMVSKALKLNMKILGQDYTKQVYRLLPHEGRVVDKMPINYLYCGLIHAALPNAQIIAVSRHPMDSCYAAFKAYLRGPYPFTYDLNDLGQYFVAFKKLMRHWQAALPRRAFHEIQYEGLVTDFEKEVRILLEFLNLDWDPEVLNFQHNPAPSATASASQIRRGVYSSSIGKWRHYEEQLDSLREHLYSEL